MRLGEGEYSKRHQPGDRTAADAWTELFQAIRRVAPEVLERLRDDVLPCFEEARAESSPLTLRKVKQADPISDEGLVPLKRAFDGWANSFYLTDQWAESIAWQTLDRWIASQEARDLLQISLPSVTWIPPVSDADREFTFSDPGWDPALETKKTFVTRIGDRFEERLQVYLAAVTHQFECQGWERTPEKRREDHFEWLARYQVQGWTHRMIADEYSTDAKILGEDTVSKALNRLANRMGLTLRPPDKGGHPRKSPT